MSLFGGIQIPRKPDLENIRKLDLLPLPQIRRMMRCGIAIDREWFWQMSSDLEAEKVELRKQITSYIPEDRLDEFVGTSSDDLTLNVESAAQIADLLFKMLGIGRGKQLKMTKGGERLSTGKKQLETLKRDHPVIPLILEYRECSKLRSTYCEPLPKVSRLHNAGTCLLCSLHHFEAHWRVHTQIVTTRTDTGRLASRKPNLQNIPARSKRGQKIRKGFVASKGKLLVSRDYAQIELRLLGDRAQETNMMRIFHEGGDIHLDTAMRAFEIDDPKKVDKILHRAPCKNVNFGVCLLEDQRVLTDRGLVAIQDIACQDRVWDGIEFVSHDGVICNGLREVIEYDGITGTPDHQVWVTDGRKMELSEAMAQRLQLAVTGCEDRPIRFTADCYRGQTDQWVPHSHGDLRGVPGRKGDVSRQYPDWQEPPLQVSTGKVFRSQVETACRAISRDQTAVRESNKRVLPELRGSGDRESVSLGGELRELCSTSSPTSNVPQGGCREDRQQRSLRAGEYSTGKSLSKSSEYAPEPKKQGLVYDIRNAGPRHRFTCEGKLVSNCYGLAAGGLLDLMALTYATAGQPMPDWLTLQWCEQFIEKWFNLYPEVAAYLELQHYRARRYEIVWTPFGRVRRIPEVRSVHTRVQMAGLRQGGNMPIQGFAADVMKIGMARVEQRLSQLRDDNRIYAEALLPIHDELVSEVDEEWADDVGEMIGFEMENALVDEDTGVLQCRVPIATDGKSFLRWQKE